MTKNKHSKTKCAAEFSNKSIFMVFVVDLMLASPERDACCALTITMAFLF